MSQQANEQNDYTRLDYEQTLQTYRMLADIRFKLLAFIPVVSGIAITFLTSDPKTVVFGTLWKTPQNPRVYA